MRRLIAARRAAGRRARLRRARRRRAPTTSTSATPPGPSSTTSRGPRWRAPASSSTRAAPAPNQLIGIRVDAGTRSAARRDRRPDVHEPGRHRDHRLHADAPARLQEPGRLGHAAVLHALPARQRRVRGRGRLRRTPPAPASTPSAAGTATRRTRRTSRRRTSTRANFPALAAYRNDSRTLLLRVGCYRRNTAPCEVGPGGRIFNVFYGAKVTVSDPTPPGDLLRRGVRPARRRPARRLGPGDGVRRRQRRHRAASRSSTSPTRPPRASSARRTTTSASPTRRASSAPTRARRARSGSPSRARTSPARRCARARCRSATATCSCASSTPAATIVDRGPFPVDVDHAVRPRRRQRLRRQGAGPRASLRFSKTKRKPRTTVRYYRKVGVRGRLINADGNPIAGAELRLLTRDLRQGADAIDRRGLRTALRRLVPRDGAREGLAPAPVRLARAGQRRRASPPTAT